MSSETDPAASHPIDANNWGTLGRILTGRKPVFLYRNVRQWRKRAARLMRSNVSSLPQDKADAGETDKPPDPMCLLSKRPANLRLPHNPDVIASDDTQCRFNPNSYHMLYVASKEAFLYKQNSFARARECHPAVTKHLNSKFHDWLANWAAKNVADSQHRLCQDWLMGRYENSIPHRTRLVTDNDLAKSPYRQYNRYRVDRLQADAAH